MKLRIYRSDLWWLSAVALAILGYIWYDNSSYAIYNRVHDRDRSVRAKAVHDIAFRLHDKKYIHEIRRMLVTDQVIRPEALYALGELGAKEYIPEIKQFLNAEDKKISIAAEDALKKLGVSDAELERLRRDREK